MADDDKNGGFKVKDNRRFDAEGNDRAEGAPVKPKDSVSKDASPATPATDKSEVDFSSFVISLATQALMQLGVMKPPTGVSIPVDRVGAKQTIDILEMLAVKTKGNLDDGETKLLTEVLHSVRMSFVKAV